MASGSVAVDAANVRTQHFSGSGLAILRSHGLGGEKANQTSSSSFTHLSSTFPLKLISPRVSSRDAGLRIARQEKEGIGGSRPVKAVAALYVVGYGGGLVSGDCVKIDIDVGEHCTLLLLTQGSTKVFKIRGKRAMMPSQSAITSQTFRCVVQHNATLIVLPDPVTCFADSQYQQKQHFDLLCPDTSSLILLDWFTPGRQHLASKNGVTVSNELWAFDLYQSRNDIRVGKEVLARDNAVLERASPNAIAEKCGHFTCFATLFLVGVDVQDIIATIEADFYQIQQSNKQQSNQRIVSTVDPLIWSCSRLGGTSSDDASTAKSSTAPMGIVVRIGGVSTEIVRIWLRDYLQLTKRLIGDDLYRQALGS